MCADRLTSMPPELLFCTTDEECEGGADMSGQGEEKNSGVFDKTTVLLMLTLINT